MNLASYHSAIQVLVSKYKGRLNLGYLCMSDFLAGEAETVYATQFFLLITLFVWHGCPLIKNRAERTGWHKLSQVRETLPLKQGRFSAGKAVWEAGRKAGRMNEFHPQKLQLQLRLHILHPCLCSI